MKHVNRTITVLVFIFLYIPMIALAVASFNEGLDIATFKGFTFRQYANLFRDETLLTLLRNDRPRRNVDGDSRRIRCQI